MYRSYRKKNPIVTDEPALNRRAEQYVGQSFTLKEPIVNGEGKIKVDDSTWKITGTDIDAGATVRVIAVEGSTLIVEGATVIVK
jgi:membrane protein implicated in regulation of membrane protease activity